MDLTELHSNAGEWMSHFFHRPAIALAVFLFAVALTPQKTVAATTAHKYRKHAKVVAVTQTASGRRLRVLRTHAGQGRTSHTKTQAAMIHSNVSRSGRGYNNASARFRASALRHRRGRHIFSNPWTEPTFADSTVGDNVDGEDLAVRKAAVDALGPYNGTVVVADPQTGRILAVVNQKLAFKGAFQPCSTVKVVVSLASLTEGIVDSNSNLQLTRRYTMDMTQALAHSNNLYFAKLGQQLGFERVSKYARMYGLGEKAGLDIQGEEPGYVTDTPPETGVGMMTSFGDGIRVTPLELTSIVSTVANGGTMFYLQYPRSQEDVRKFVPRIKRTFQIASFLPQLRAGMLGATEFGTARRASANGSDTILGKTGTCTDTAQPGVHLGWFGSFNDIARNKLAVIVLLTGGRGISGPIASGVAGNVYHNLSAQHYFLPDQPSAPTALVSIGN